MIFAAILCCITTAKSQTDVQNNEDGQIDTVKISNVQSDAAQLVNSEQFQQFMTAAQAMEDKFRANFEKLSPSQKAELKKLFEQKLDDPSKIVQQMGAILNFDFLQQMDSLAQKAQAMKESGLIKPEFTKEVIEDAYRKQNRLWKMFDFDVMKVQEDSTMLQEPVTNYEIKGTYEGTTN